jgi:hypothetical protein
MYSQLSPSNILAVLILSPLQVQAYMLNPLQAHTEFGKKDEM